MDDTAFVALSDWPRVGLDTNKQLLRRWEDKLLEKAGVPLQKDKVRRS